MKKTQKRRTPARSAATAPAGAADEQVRQLMDELQAHSQEFTVQNAHLNRAEAEIASARVRYAELYDFAPIGYLVLDLHGVIHECNVAASALLSRPRRLLLNVPLSTLLIDEHRPSLRDFLQHVASAGDGANAIEAQVDLAPRRTVRLFAKTRPAGAGPQMLFTALLDVTVERQLENERLGMLERLVTMQEEERRRLSRELHDELGQQVTALRLTLSVLRELGGNPETRQQLDFADGIATRLDHDVDHLARALRPAALEVGLVPALHTFVRRWSEYHGIPASLEASSITGLPSDVENHLYRIVQEALHNVVKHAQATHASITLDQSAHHLRLAIHDNGHGFDSGIKDHAGIGFLGMRERVALIGGDIQVDSQAGDGTTISIRVPRPTSAPTVG